jgi:hypothetical protein
MRSIKRYSNERATLCSGKNCITVYGEAAKIISSIAVCAVLIVAAAYVIKALR